MIANSPVCKSSAFCNSAGGQALKVELQAVSEGTDLNWSRLLLNTSVTNRFKGSADVFVEGPPSAKAEKISS